MRVAIVHYHLQPGGVTRIIHHTLKSLEDSGLSIVVLTGKEPHFDLPGKYRVIPGLQYEAFRSLVSAAELAGQMLDAATEALGGLPDIWHVHNHSLGKNLALPGALRDLAMQGYPVLFHIHDFAEDGRPANYRLMFEEMAFGSEREMSKQLYPLGGHLHYGVLNTRDFAYLHDAGVAKKCLHLLPNPVYLDLGCEEIPQKRRSGEQLWIYPTRAIRRKNIGEFLLWAAMAHQGTRFATTLGPENPAERHRYEHWQKVAAELELPVEFELASRFKGGFIELLRKADGLISTSIAEGFGLAFLEPWLVSRPMCGRDLPEITDEFRQEGIELDWVYDRLDIPVKWLGIEWIADSAWAGLEHNMSAYRRKPSRADHDRLLAAWVRHGSVDFGRLDEKMQEVVLRKLVQDPEKATAMKPRQLPQPDDCGWAINKNCLLLKEQYSLKGYGVKVMDVYQQLLSSSPTKVGSLDGQVLLDHFLAPERLSLLRVE